MNTPQSLRRRLPLLISALLGGVVAAVCWSAYRQIESVLIAATETRLTSATVRLASMLEESARRIRGEAHKLATDSALVRFLAHETAATRAAAATLLERERLRASQPVSLGVWSRDGQLRLAVGPDQLARGAAAVPGAPAGGSPAGGSPAGGTGGGGAGAPSDAWTGPLVPTDSGVAYATVAPVLGARGDTVGFVVAHRRLRGGPGAQQIAGLIGPHATLSIGNAAGGPWSDLSRTVAAPARRVTPGEMTQLTTPDGVRLLGTAAPIRATPWVVWVQLPRDVVLASAQPFVLRIAQIGLLVIAAGAIGAWVLSRRVTAPLLDLTRAAQELARGEYARRVAVTRRDEIGSLARSFNSMTAQVDAASRALRARASELEAANTDLRESEERYRRLVEAAHEGICVVDPAGVVTYANGRLAEMLGHDVADLVGASVFAFMDADTAFDARTRFARRQRGIAESQEIAFRRKDGSTLWTHKSVSSLFDAGGSFTGALFMLSDVTERHDARERLARSERQFRALIENASDMICVLDADGRQRYASPAHERFVGFTPAELEGQLAFDSIHPDDVPRAAAAFAQALQRPGERVAVRFRYRHKNGSWREFASVAMNLLHDPAVGGVIVNSHDATDERALEARLLQSQKMEAVGQLAGGVAHDFNNLLTVMTGYVGILVSDAPEGDPTRADLQEIQRAAERAAGLTRQLLAFSRQQVLEPRVLSLNAVVRDLENMLGRVLREDVRVETRLRADAGRVSADPGQLEQVIVNLAVNARDAMPGGGALTIETAEVALDETFARVHPDVVPGPYVMLAVSDTGCGMSAETQARIFEPFFTTKPVGQGTGLGLSTVYGIVKQSGGHVTVYSEPGVGTTFKVYLPRAGAADAGRPHGRSDPALRAGSETVLLVEDDAQVRAAARRILERAGYSVLAAASGSDALELSAAHDSAIDLLLTDLVMPEMNGRELAGRLLELRPHTRTAFMSGYTHDAALRQGGFEPGTVFIPKPFTPHGLTEKVREALEAAPREVDLAAARALR